MERINKKIKDYKASYLTTKKQLREYKQLAKDYKLMTEQLAFYVGIIQPFSTIPQLWKIYGLKQAAGVSLFTWVAYTIGGLIFFTYGVIHKLKPVYYPQVLWIAMQVAMVIGIIRYG